MPYCHESSNTSIRMWYQYVTINYAIHTIYIHPHYCFRPEENDSKLFSARNDTNTTKNELHKKYSTMISDRGNNIYTALNNDKIFPTDCDTQKFIIQNRYSYGYEYIYSMISANHPNKLNHNIDLIAAPPTQLKTGYPLSKYFNR